MINEGVVDAIADRGFRYGMQVFETILVRAGRAVFAGAHLERLVAACNMAGIFINNQEVERASQALALPPIESGIIRLHVSAGTGALTDPVRFPQWHVICEQRPALDLPIPPARLTCSMIPAAPFPPGLKSGNYWRNASAQAQAVDAGFTDALMFDGDGCLVSCATGNVLVRVEEHWVTPHAGTGRREGVVLAWLAPRLGARPAVITRRDLSTAQSVIVCNSWWGPRLAACIDECPLRMAPEAEEVIQEYWKEIDQLE